MIISKLIKSKRHQETLEYALDKIMKSPIISYIEKIYLYGSCARGEEKFNSDVDLLIVFDKNIEESENYKELLNECSLIALNVMPKFQKKDLPDVDLRFYCGNKLEDEKRVYYRMINYDKKLIYEKEK